VKVLVNNDNWGHHQIPENTSGWEFSQPYSGKLGISPNPLKMSQANVFFKHYTKFAEASSPYEVGYMVITPKGDVSYLVCLVFCCRLQN
jgi:hypothetical protein